MGKRPGRARTCSQGTPRSDDAGGSPTLDLRIHRATKAAPRGEAERAKLFTGIEAKANMRNRKRIQRHPACPATMPETLNQN